MLDLTLASLVERNKIASAAPQYVLLQVTVDENAGEVLYLAQSPVEVVWRGQTWIPFNFDLDAYEEKGQGQLSTLQLRVSNVNRLLQTYLEQYDGGVGATVNLYGVNAVNLPDGPADVSLTFEITSTESAQEWVTFTLGADSPLRKSFPKYTFQRAQCRHMYNSPDLQAADDPRGLGCAYQGALAICNRTIEDCRAHGNTSRFGGFPGIDSTGFRTASVV
jgi:phage-related protein